MQPPNWISNQGSIPSKYLVKMEEDQPTEQVIGHIIADNMVVQAGHIKHRSRSSLEDIETGPQSHSNSDYTTYSKLFSQVVPRNQETQSLERPPTDSGVAMKKAKSAFHISMKEPKKIKFPFPIFFHKKDEKYENSKEHLETGIRTATFTEGVIVEKLDWHLFDFFNSHREIASEVIVNEILLKKDYLEISNLTERLKEIKADYPNGNIPYLSQKLPDFDKFHDIRFFYNQLKLKTDKEIFLILIGGKEVFEIEEKFRTKSFKKKCVEKINSWKKELGKYKKIKINRIISKIDSSKFLNFDFEQFIASFRKIQFDTNMSSVTPFSIQDSPIKLPTSEKWNAFFDEKDQINPENSDLHACAAIIYQIERSLFTTESQPFQYFKKLSEIKNMFNDNFEEKKLLIKFFTETLDLLKKEKFYESIASQLMLRFNNEFYEKTSSLIQAAESVILNEKSLFYKELNEALENELHLKHLVDFELPSRLLSIIINHERNRLFDEAFKSSFSLIRCLNFGTFGICIEYLKQKNNSLFQKSESGFQITNQNKLNYEIDVIKDSFVVDIRNHLKLNFTPLKSEGAEHLKQSYIQVGKTETCFKIQGDLKEVLYKGEILIEPFV